MIFKGTTNTFEVGAVLTSAAEVESFSISNKSGGVATISVGIFSGSTITYILYNEPLAAAGTVTCNYIYLGKPIIVPIGYQIIVSASASCDFYFSIKGYNGST